MTRARTLSKLGSDPLVTDGTVIAGITTINASGLNITGVITATTFKGDVTGDVTGSATGLSGNITSSGTLSITDATASTSSSTGALKVSGGVGIAKSLFVGEGVSVAGTITYADVTNIDSIGIVTAGKGLRATTGGLIVTAGVSTFTTDVSIADKIVHTGDTDTAIRFSGTDTFTVESGGVQRIRVGAAHSNAIGLGHYAANSTGPFVQISRGQGYDKTTLNPSTTFLHLGGEDNSSSLGYYGIGFGYIYGNPATTAPAYIAYEDKNSGSYTYGDLTFWTKDRVTTNTNAIERMRITAGGGILLSNGILVEKCKIVTTAWSTTNDISLDDGNVFLNTANLAGTTNTIDITSSNGIANDLAVGDMTSVTLITAVNAATAYINHITIGAAAVTESWVGGSAPSDGGSSGYDVYTFNIIKTAATPTYVVIANQVKGS